MTVNKEKINKIDNYYTKIPNDIFRFKFCAGVIAVYVYLCHNAEHFNPSVRHIANTLKISKNSVRKYLTILCAYGIIEIVESGDRNKVTVYKFNHPGDWHYPNIEKELTGN